MLSRVADAVYWASRYVERAENVSRFVNVNLDLMLEAQSSQRPSWEPLVLTSGDQDWFREHYEAPTVENVVKFLIFDRRYPNSVVSSVSTARENARTVREVISREMWQELNALYLMVKEAGQTQGPVGEMAEYFERIKMAGIHFAGVTDATLIQGPAWHFSRLGRLLERADKTSRILDVKYYSLLTSHQEQDQSHLDLVGWTALLNSASALQMYRQVHHIISPENVASFLLLNKDFPRSIRHCLRKAQENLHALTGTPIGTYENEAERLLGTLCARLDFATIDEVREQGLHAYLDALQTTLNQVGEAIFQRFFAHGN